MKNVWVTFLKGNAGDYIYYRFTDETMEEQESWLTKKFIQKDLDEEQPCLLTFLAQGV